MKRQDNVSDHLTEGEARRRFLAQCGRFAIVTPPAMTMLLSVAAKPMEAHASTILGGGSKPPKSPKPPKPPKKSKPK